MCKREKVSCSSKNAHRVCSALVLSFLSAFVAALGASAQVRTQQIDEEYTRLINEYLTDARISTELVNYLPASDVVPTTLEFPGIERIVGTPDELTYAEDITRYLKAVAAAAPERARIIPMGLTEEGREMIVIAIANEETMANLEMAVIPGTHAGPDGAPYKPIFGEKLIEFLGKH